MSWISTGVRLELEMVCSTTAMEGQKWFSGNSHLKTSWIQHQIYQKDGFLSHSSPILASSSSSSSSSFGVTTNLHKESISSQSSKISPAVLFIIVILAVLFFISGLLHLLVRFLTKHPLSSESNRNLTSSSSDALQRQLQQLFHLHDSGLDQACIDALPVFSYKEIDGPKEPFDCAVCLCEFTEIDQLRLLPMCSHAFHINCIDTWLLSNSSCPLCRGTLLNPGFSTEIPIFHFDDFKEEDGPVHGENRLLTTLKRIEIEEVVKKKGVFPVRLGKFQKMNCVEEEIGAESSSSRLDGRRCYSLGSYQYLVGDVNLTVSLNQEGNHVMKVAKGIGQTNNTSSEEIAERKKISISSKTDSLSISKIWLWPKKEKFGGSSDVQFDNSP